MTMVRCLSVHANYRCQHSGDCCTSGWPIPDDKGGLLPMTAHGCAFHNAGLHRCEIHAADGHDALPLACRQFPRVTVQDPRGVSVTLSHYCPTARGLLSTYAGPVTVVDDAPAFPADGEYVGLDARASLPPSLCPDVLMDWESWWEWECLSVELCNLNETPRQIVARLSVAVEHVRMWRPGQGELIDRVHEAFRTALTNPTNLTPPHEQNPTNLPNRSHLTNRLLASHAFANWTAHLGEGLRTWLRSLETVVFLLEEGWTVREVDLWLRHFADPRLLAKVWSTVERD
jgi:hypothetical protein